MPYNNSDSPGRRVGVRLLLQSCAFIILVFSTTTPIRAQTFLDLKLGMKAVDAMPILHKSCIEFEGLPFIGGNRIVSDTMMLPFCIIPMRRSVGFDSTSKLAVIGLTHQATRNDIDYKEHCVYEWLKDLYGPPIDTVVHDESTKYRWYLGRAQVTFEAKGYNEKDYFLLLYYYPREDSALN